MDLASAHFFARHHFAVKQLVLLSTQRQKSPEVTHMATDTEKEMNQIKSDIAVLVAMAAGTALGANPDLRRRVGVLLKEFSRDPRDDGRDC